jgi:hypothetical protein
MSTLTTAQYHAVLHDVRKHLRYDSTVEFPEDIRVRQRLQDRTRERNFQRAERLLSGYEPRQVEPEWDRQPVSTGYRDLVAA